jgi:two-component SAPR family response regulator
MHEVTGLRLGRDDAGLIQWPEGVSVDSVDARFERLVAEANVITGRERRIRLEESLRLVTGDYLAKSDLPWAENRRYQIDVIREEALVELISLCVDSGDYVDVREYAEQLLAINAYCDEAYRRLIQVEQAIGTEAAARAAYRRGLRALQDLGLPPERASKLLEVRVSVRSSDRPV